MVAVNGSGPVRPVLTSTINVKVPYVDSICTKKKKCWNTDKVGLALSIGPALQLGQGSSNVSQLGLFGGLSIVLGRFLITPGVHVGEFADFPLGFTHAGQPIPATFTQQLTPVTRTTVRFGVGVTFRGFSLLKSSSGPKATAPTTPSAKSGTDTKTKLGRFMVGTPMQCGRWILPCLCAVGLIMFTNCSGKTSEPVQGGQIPASQDKDGDGVPDDWEAKGVDYTYPPDNSHQHLDLKGIGASPPSSRHVCFRVASMKMTSIRTARARGVTHCGAIVRQFSYRESGQLSGDRCTFRDSSKTSP